MQRQQAYAGQLDATLVAVEPAEQLVAAADGQKGGACGVGVAERRPEGGQLGRDQLLLAVLAAADVEEIVLTGADRRAGAEGPDLELVAAPGRPGAQDRDVAAIRVDVEVIREKVADDELFHGPNGTAPRLITRKGEPPPSSPGRGMPRSPVRNTFRQVRRWKCWTDLR